MHIFCIFVGSKVFKELLDQFQTRKEGTSLIPFILETSGFLWARSANLHQNRESFSAFRLKFFEKEQLELLLTEPLYGFSEVPVFTKVSFFFLFLFLAFI